MFTNTNSKTMTWTFGMRARPDLPSWCQTWSPKYGTTRSRSRRTKPGCWSSLRIPTNRPGTASVTSSWRTSKGHWKDLQCFWKVTSLVSYRGCMGTRTTRPTSRRQRSRCCHCPMSCLCSSWRSRSISRSRNSSPRLPSRPSTRSLSSPTTSGPSWTRSDSSSTWGFAKQNWAITSGTNPNLLSWSDLSERVYLAATDTSRSSPMATFSTITSQPCTTLLRCRNGKVLFGLRNSAPGTSLGCRR